MVFLTPGGMASVGGARCVGGNTMAMNTAFRDPTRLTRRTPAAPVGSGRCRRAAVVFGALNIPLLPDLANGNFPARVQALAAFVAQYFFIEKTEWNASWMLRASTSMP